jgi:hypothetical protein
MKSTKTLVLAASILALTLTAFPHVAAAGTVVAPQQASSDLTRKAGGSNLLYVQVIVVAGNLISLLLP